MSVVVEPASVGQIAEVVRACEAERLALAPIGAARTLAEVRRTPATIGLSLSAMSRIIAYEPADMTITVEAGISVAALNQAMETSKQRLPVDPRAPESTTAGALIAAAQSGPLRLSEGTVRDLLIGIRYAGHGGKIVHSGGRVVKNVAGYDLMKVMTGSFGTLGIITEATFKVRPTPELYTMICVQCDSADAAFDTARKIIDAHLPAHLEILSPAAAPACGWVRGFFLLAGLSGNRREVETQRDAIMRLAPMGTRLEEDSLPAYVRVRDFDLPKSPLAAQVAVPPAELAATLSSMECEFVAHSGSGVATVFMVDHSGEVQATLERWRKIARAARGHVRVIHCDPALRGSVEFFDTPNDGALGLMRRLKSVFDPAGVFNPGCFVGGI